MGRAKLNMELIKKEKSRLVTYKKRKEGLTRKIQEFTTLCDVNACMIIYGPKSENSCMNPEIWPENPDEIFRMINTYKSKAKDSATRVFGLPDFFHERKKRMEDELEKLRKKNLEIKYPTWIDPMSHLSEMELRKFAQTLSNKLQVVNSRIESIILKGNDHQHHNNDHDHIQNNRYLIMEGSHDQQPNQKIDYTAATAYNNHYTRLSGLIQRGIELELMNQQEVMMNIPSAQMNQNFEMHVPTIHDQEEYHHEMHSANQNSMMMLLMNENHHHQNHQAQFAGSASSFQCASFKYHEPTATGGAGAGIGGMAGGRGGGMVDDIVYNHPRPLAGFYVPPSVQQVVSPPYMQYPPNVSPQMHPSRENACSDIIHCRVMDQKPPRI